MLSNPLHWSRPKKLVILTAVASFFLLTLYGLRRDSFDDGFQLSWQSLSGSPRDKCPPLAYALGQWEWAPKTNITKMTDKHQITTFGGFHSCAADREYDWHLGTDQQEKFSRSPKVQSYAWKPSSRCVNLRPMDSASIVKDLVEKGSWYLVGDSVTENHFFSLSCTLAPHVFATPNYTLNPYFDRAWPQHLFLNPNSPVVKDITLPKGFNITGTPLVTFRRIDLIMSKEELIDIHRSIQPPNVNADKNTLFSDEATWTLPIDEYFGEFIAPLPAAHYGTMIIGTAGHWTTSLLNQTIPTGIDGVLNLFKAATKHWAIRAQALLDKANKDCTRFGCEVPRRRAVIRDYLPGHENCFNKHEPDTSITAYSRQWYNWNNIPQFNDVWNALLGNGQYRDIAYLPIGRPGRLRPDAHANGDCLHMISGTGVLEGWTHYIWHYVTQESP